MGNYERNSVPPFLTAGGRRAAEESESQGKGEGRRRRRTLRSYFHSFVARFGKRGEEKGGIFLVVGGGFFTSSLSRIEEAERGENKTHDTVGGTSPHCVMAESRERKGDGEKKKER